MSKQEKDKNKLQPKSSMKLAQEAFLKAWQKLHTLKSPGAFGSWLRRIAVNIFLQHIRIESDQTQRPSKRTDPPPDAYLQPSGFDL